MNSFISNVIYSLKREYGLSAILVDIISATIDINTGNERKTVRYIPINRAVFLPSNILRMFVKGGTDYDVDKKYILIDYKDINITPEIEDYIVFNDKQYIIEKVDIFDINLAYILTVKESLGSAFESDIIIEDTATITGEILDSLE